MQATRESINGQIPARHRETHTHPSKRIIRSKSTYHREVNGQITATRRAKHKQTIRSKSTYHAGMRQVINAQRAARHGETWHDREGWTRDADVWLCRSRSAVCVCI